MFDLETLFKKLGVIAPLGLVGVIAAVLAWGGHPLGEVTAVAGALVGLQLAGALLVDVLKYTGVVSAGKSGVWSAWWNLGTLAFVAVHFQFFPSFDIYQFDLQVGDLARLLGFVFVYVVQILGTKAVHVKAVDYGVGYRFK